MEEQPFYKEARQYLQSAVLGKKVAVDVLRKDQYGRIVGMVRVADWTSFKRRNVGLEMVAKGLAVVYRASGAVYGNLEGSLLNAEAAAKWVCKRASHE